jgi:hypothetical protein
MISRRRFASARWCRCCRGIFYAVLVVDEVGWLTCGIDAANMLFHAVQTSVSTQARDDLHDSQAAEGSPYQKSGSCGNHCCYSQRSLAFGAMAVLISVLMTLRDGAHSRAAWPLEVLALQHQLRVLERSHSRRLRLTRLDRRLGSDCHEPGASDGRR